MNADPVARLNQALQSRYRIAERIGEGGMAAVFLADDLRHERKVALKVLKPELAAVVGAERFLAEIRTTANLQHPYILPLFDSGEVDGFLYYVMPHVEGESLREKLDREKQLGVGEALDITRKVADALDYAHEKGVVHRDVKPANILLSRRGEPLVADFGIALAVAQAGGGRITETGLSLGTPHYMSPEQATGDRDVDPRSDVYALGCVLYEMLAAEPPFAAPTAQAVLVRILTTDAAPITGVRRTVPPHVDAALAKALEKLPADRFESAADFAEALATPSYRYRRSGVETVTTPGHPETGSRNPGRMALGAAVVALAAVAAWGWLRSPPGGLLDVPVTESRVYTGPEVSVDRSTEFALSPDGTRLAFTGTDSTGVSGVWLRPLADETVERVPTGENGRFPFWSPDGAFIGFTAGGELRVVEVESGRARALCTVDHPAPASWGPDGDIFYTHESVVYRVTLEGGSCMPVTLPEGTTGGHRRPTGLPDGRVLFSTKGVDGSLWVSEPGQPAELLLENAWNPTFIPPDWLIYHDSPVRAVATGGAMPLLARSFDPVGLEFMSEPTPIFGSIWAPNGDASYSATPAGHLVAIHAPTVPNRIAWVTREGRVEESFVAPADLWTLALSSDGQRVALGGWGLWLYDRGRGVAEELLPDMEEGRVTNYPDWAPGDSMIAFSAVLGGPNGVYSYHLREGRLDTLRTESRLIEKAVWSRDGRAIVSRLAAGQGAPADDVWIHEMTSGDARRLFEARDDRSEVQTLAFSPAGRWLLYSSTASGIPELFVRSYPDFGAARPVTGSGGLLGHWSASGDTIFYVTTTDDLMAVPFGETGPGSLGAPVLIQRDDDLKHLWGVGDGNETFLRLERTAEERAPPMRLITNWKARAKGGTR